MDKHEHDIISKETIKWLDFLYEGICVVDTRKMVVYLNKGAEITTGYLAADMIGTKCGENILNHLDSKGRELSKKDNPLEMALEGKATETKLFLKHQKGNLVPVAVNIRPLKNEEDEITGAIEIFKDISAEEKLGHLEEKFKKVIKQYVSETTYKQVVRSVNHENYNFIGRNRDLTILFMDIVGFTSLSEKLDPEKVVDMLNAYFSLTSLIIQKNNGDIDKFLGDGVMAIFKNAGDSIEAAKDMLHTGLKKLNHTLRSMDLPAIDIRIGINSGNLIQGNIGSEDRKDWTVVGDVVNTASRIEESAEPGTIRISEHTIKRLNNPEKYTFVKEMMLKGKSTSVKVYSPA